MEEKIVKTVLIDGFFGNNKKLPMEITLGSHAILFNPKGYGEKTSIKGEGSPIAIEYYEGKLRVLVWSDINSEDPTHTIDLEGALESNRKEETKV